MVTTSFLWTPVVGSRFALPPSTPGNVQVVQVKTPYGLFRCTGRMSWEGYPNHPPKFVVDSVTKEPS